MKGAAWVGLVALSIVIAIFFEWHTDEVTVVLAVMSLLALFVGAFRPQWAIPGGAAIGFSITVAHVVTESAGVMRPHYVHSTPSAGDWAAMAIAGLFVTAVAWAGGRIRSLVAREALNAGGTH